jgi:Na+/melibiose symporter-like transporter
MDHFGPQSAVPRLWMPGVVCVGLAVLGTWFAMRMRPLKPQRPELKLGKSPFGQLPATIRTLRREKGLFGMVVLYSMFWFNSALVNQAINGMGLPGYLDVPVDAKTELSILLGMVSVGIIVGSALAPRLAKKLPLSKLVWGGGLAMAGLQLLLLLIGPVLDRHNGGLYFAGAVLCLVGIAGAIFVVPVQSYLQDAPPPGMRGQTFAVNNFMNFLCMFVAGVVYMFGAGLLGPTGTQVLGAASMVVCLWWVRRAVGLMSIGGSAVAG